MLKIIGRKLGLLALILLLMGAVSVNAEEIEPVATVSNQGTYVIAEGAKYYQSAWGFGTGRWGGVSDGNPYTEIPCEGTLNRYAYLNKEGEVIESGVLHSKEDQTCPEIPEAPEGADKLWVHFITELYCNGWTDYSNCQWVPATTAGQSAEGEQKNPGVVVEEEAKAAEDVVEEIVEVISDKEEAKKTVLVVDVSGSMDTEQAKVLRLINDLELDAFAAIWVFAEKACCVTQEQLVNQDFNVGTVTYMRKAFNKMLMEESGVEHIILISDLVLMDGEYMLANDPKIKSIEIYDPLWNYEDNGELTSFKTAWPNAAVVWNKLGE